MGKIKNSGASTSEDIAFACTSLTKCAQPAHNSQLRVQRVRAWPNGPGRRKCARGTEHGANARAPLAWASGGSISGSKRLAGARAGVRVPPGARATRGVAALGGQVREPARDPAGPALRGAWRLQEASSRPGEVALISRSRAWAANVAAQWSSLEFPGSRPTRVLTYRRCPSSCFWSL